MMDRRKFLKASGVGAAAGFAVAAVTSPAVAQASTENNPAEEKTRLAKSFFTTNDGATIFYKDWGPENAQPIYFHHGWPTTSDDWDNQMLFFLNQGFRVVAHD